MAALIDAFIGLDDRAAHREVTAALSQSDSAEVIGRLILPAARGLSESHRRGSLDAAGLAAATSLARRAVALAGSAGGAVPTRPHSVVVAAPTATGDLEADGVYETLMASGYRAQLLISPPEVDGLARHLSLHAPLAVVVAAEEARILPAIAGLAAAAGQVGLPVLATGRAFGVDGARSARIGATSWAPDPVGVLAVLDRWASVGGALPLNVSEPVDAALVRAAWPAVIMAAAGNGGPDEAWADATVRSIGELLVATLWAADTAVLLDWLDLQLTGPDRTHVRDVHVVGLLDAVASALPPTMRGPSEVLSEARDHLRERILRPSDGGIGDALPALQTALTDAASTSLPVPDLPSQAPSPPLGGPSPATSSPPAGVTHANGSPAVAGAVPRTLMSVPAAGDGGAAAAGQVFADLLLLAALSAQTTAAVLAVAQPGGRWSPLAHGLEQRDGLGDPLLWSAIASRQEPVEIGDLTQHPDLARSRFSASPLSLRWAYGMALRDQGGAVIGVVCLFDRGVRNVSRREQRTLAATARQLTAQLVQLRRPAPLASAAPVMGNPAWQALRPVDGRSTPSRRAAVLPDGQQLLRSHEVAVLFDVTERTVINWAAAGKLPSLRTIGGHLRFRSDDVYGLLSARQTGS